MRLPASGYSVTSEASFGEPSPGTLFLPHGPSVLTVRGAGRDRGGTRVPVDVGPGDSLHVGLRSLERGRIGGALTIGMGVAGSALAAGAVGAAASCEVRGGSGIGLGGGGGGSSTDCSRVAASIVVGVVSGALAIVTGAVLADLDDEPIVTLSGQRGVRAFAPRGRTWRVLPATLLAIDVALPVVALGFVAQQEPATRGLGEAGTLLVGALALATAPFMVTLGAELAGGRGELLGALVGSLAGWLVGGLIVGISAATGQAQELLASTGGIVAGIAGSVIGYEITHDAALDRDAHGELGEVTPSFSAGPDGAALSLSGSF